MPGGCGPTRIGTRELSATGFGLLFRLYKEKIGISELEFLRSLWGLGTEQEEGYRTGPPGYIGWRNLFLGINSGVPYTF